jgi:hypothetical protein
VIDHDSVGNVIRSRASEALVSQTETPDQKPSRIRRLLTEFQYFLTLPSKEAELLRAADREAFETLKTTCKSLSTKVSGIFRKTPSTPEDPSATMEDLSGLKDYELEQRLYDNEKKEMKNAHATREMTSRARKLNPSISWSELFNLPESIKIDSEHYDLLDRNVLIRSVLEKRFTPDEFRELNERLDARLEEARAQEEKSETPIARRGRIRRMFRGMNDFLNLPSKEAARLRQTDIEASETLARALGSLAGKVPDLFKKAPNEAIEPPNPEAQISKTVEPSDSSQRNFEQAYPELVRILRNNPAKARNS